MGQILTVTEQAPRTTPLLVLGDAGGRQLGPKGKRKRLYSRHNASVRALDKCVR
jgi:hypothetical protein